MPATTKDTGSRRGTTPSTAADRLTTRDARMLRLIAEHRVLTTRQLTSILFTHDSKTRLRINTLREAGLLETFRPPSHRGSQPKYCVVTAKALRLLGLSDRPAPPSAPGQAATAAALRTDLDHLRGVNDFFCGLHAHARAHPESVLEEWRSEWSTAKLFPGRVRPDGFGRWRDGAGWCEFFLEYDTGTEPLHRLLAKLAGYADLMATADTCSPVLFWLRSLGREEHLHALLADSGIEVPAATAVGNAADVYVAEAVWRPTFASRRLSLAELGQAACDHLGVPHRQHVL